MIDLAEKLYNESEAWKLRVFETKMRKRAVNSSQHLIEDMRFLFNPDDRVDFGVKYIEFNYNRMNNRSWSLGKVIKPQSIK